MFAQMLKAQWKWSRDTLAFFMIAGFATPLVVLTIFIPSVGISSPRELITAGSVVGGFCLVFAVLAGFAIAVQGYSADDRTGHIYALSLPISRGRYLAARTMAGYALLALPALAILLGAAIAAGQVDVPVTLRTYAISLAIRALLAAWLAHAFVFALCHAAGRRAKLVFLVLMLSVGGAVMVTGMLAPEAREAVSRGGQFLISHPGPFGIFFGRWSLFDV